MDKKLTKKIGFEKVILYVVIGYVGYRIISEWMRNRGEEESVVEGDLSGGLIDSGVVIYDSADGLPETKRIVGGGDKGDGIVTVESNQANWKKMNRCKNRFTDGAGNTCCGGDNTWCIDSSSGGYGATLSEAPSDVNPGGTYGGGGYTKPRYTSRR